MLQRGSAGAMYSTPASAAAAVAAELAAAAASALQRSALDRRKRAQRRVLTELRRVRLGARHRHAASGLALQILGCLVVRVARLAVAEEHAHTGEGAFRDGAPRSKVERRGGQVLLAAAAELGAGVHNGACSAGRDGSRSRVGSCVQARSASARRHADAQREARTLVQHQSGLRHEISAALDSSESSGRNSCRAHRRVRRAQDAARSAQCAPWIAATAALAAPGVAVWKKRATFCWPGSCGPSAGRADLPASTRAPLSSRASVSRARSAAPPACEGRKGVGGSVVRSRRRVWAPDRLCRAPASQEPRRSARPRRAAAPRAAARAAARAIARSGARRSACGPLAPSSCASAPCLQAKQRRRPSARDSQVARRARRRPARRGRRIADSAVQASGPAAPARARGPSRTRGRRQAMAAGRGRAVRLGSRAAPSSAPPHRVEWCCAAAKIVPAARPCAPPEAPTRAHGGQRVPAQRHSTTARLNSSGSGETWPRG